jgi:hypothetical protein
VEDGGRDDAEGVDETMKVEQPNARDVIFDCPWTGHWADPRFVIRNSSAPNIIGQRCIKCGCLVYTLVEPEQPKPESQVVGADGMPLPKE